MKTKYFLSIIFVSLASIAGFLLQGNLEPTNLVMLYLVAVLLSAFFLGKGPAIVSSIIGVIAFDVLFVPPRFHLSVNDAQYFITFAGLLLTGLLISELVTQLRKKVNAALVNEQRALSLYEMSQKLSNATTIESIIFIINDTIKKTLGINSILLINDKENYDNSNVVMEFPTYSSSGMVGKILTMDRKQEILKIPGNIQWLETIASQTGITIERVMLFQETKRMELIQEKEKLQSALLNSLSHDMRTPLVAIIGTLSHLANGSRETGNRFENEMIINAYGEAERLNSLVSHWLDMVRAETDNFKPNQKHCDLNDLLGVTLRTFQNLQSHTININISDNLPEMQIDPVLLQKVLMNLLENSIKFSPSGTNIDIDIKCTDTNLSINISDKGIGIPEDELEKVFDKFYRSSRTKSYPGVGLGLSICRAIIQAHGGNITVNTRSEGGTTFVITFPLLRKQPLVL